MRRAVSTCTSPEVFFGPAGANEAALLTANLPSTDPLGLAMEALSV
jgi:alpha,alpha-trehalase